MTIDELPLIELFTRLRQAGLPLGMTEYQLVLQALQNGFGIPDKAALARLCCTLWVKSEEDQILFNYHFSAVMAKDEANLVPLLEPEPSTVAIETAQPSNPLFAWWQKTSLPTRLALGGTLVCGVGLALWVIKPVRQCPFFVSVPLTFVERGEEYDYEIGVESCEPDAVKNVSAETELAETGSAETGLEESIEITVLQKHPWLELEKQQDGTTVLSGKIPDHDIRYSNTSLWTTEGEKLTDFDQLDNIADIQVSEDGKLLATRLFNQRARLWTTQGKKISDFNNIKGIENIQFGGNGQFLVTHLSDETAQLWNAQGEKLSDFENLNEIEDIQLSENGELVVTRHTDQTARLWDSQGKQIVELGELNRPDSVQFSPEGTFMIIFPAGEQPQLWNEEGRVAVLDKVDRPNDIVFSKDGQRLVSRSSNKTATLWDTQGQKLSDFDGIDSVRHIRFSADGQLIISQLSNKTAHLWDAQGNELAELGKINWGRFSNYQIIDGQKIPVFSNIRFSKDNQLLVALAPNKTAKLWDAAGNNLANLGKVGDRYFDIRFSENSQFLAIRISGKTAQVWDAQGNKITDFDNLQNIKSLHLSENGQLVATRLSNKTAQLWDAQGNKITDFDNLQNVKSIQLSENGQLVVTRLSNKTAQLWDAQGNKITDFGNLQSIQSIRFSENGQLVVTRLSNKTAQLWDAQGNRVADIGQLQLNGYRSSPAIRFIDDSQLLVVLSGERIGQLWNSQGQAIAEFEEINSINTYAMNDNSYRDSRGRRSNTLYLKFIRDRQLFLAFNISSAVTLQVTDKTTNQTDQQSFPLQSFNDSSAFDEKLGLWMRNIGYSSAALIFLVLPVLYMAARWLAERYAQPTLFPALPEPIKHSPTAISALNDGLEDEVQVAQAVRQEGRQNSRQNTELPLTAFTQTHEYFPVTGRQMKQSWRYLRRLVREGPPVELDVEATVAQVSHLGMLLNPVLRPRRINHNELLLLVDQEGSMVPFHALSERLAKTAMQGGRFARAGIHYFHNCPCEYLYRDPYHQVADPIQSVLSPLHPEFAGVLIFSDAGAARGAFNPERLALTADFLEQLRQRLRYVVWLNPMPRDRWTGTAGEIAQLVPMFELSRQGLTQSIDVLRGKSTY